MSSSSICSFVIPSNGSLLLPELPPFPPAFLLLDLFFFPGAGRFEDEKLAQLGRGMAISGLKELALAINVGFWSRR